MNIQNPAHALLHEMMAARLVRAMDAALADGRAWWRRDPQHRGVWALFAEDRPVIIVYTEDHDFEVADDIEEVLA